LLEHIRLLWAIISYVLSIPFFFCNTVKITQPPPYERVAPIVS
jgi:hypothetical protein